jgi:trans-2,3-dihydro-3-hydroxyanthranilate isomerase
MTALEYQLWDVFTATAYAGNQLAVVPHAEGLDAATMQRIANEFALPETVFLLPPQDRACRFALRIFTPRRELPMAGHPTIGALFAIEEEPATGGADSPLFG